MPTPATKVACSSERIGCEAADARWIWSNVPCHMTLDYRLCHEPAQLARQPEDQALGEARRGWALPAREAPCADRRAASAGGRAPRGAQTRRGAREIGRAHV